ncbi:hypothetical protein Emag_005703 [Eimeria magna]
MLQSTSSSSKTLLLLLLLLLFFASACPLCCGCCSNTSGLLQQPLVGLDLSTPLRSPLPLDVLSAAAAAAAVAVSASLPSSSSSSSSEAPELPGSMASAAAAFVSPLRGALPPLRPAAAAYGRRSWLAPRPSAAAATAAAAAATEAAAAAAAAGVDCFAEEEGIGGSETFRIYFKRRDGSRCSPWHHVTPFIENSRTHPSEALQQKDIHSNVFSQHQPNPYTPGNVAAAAGRAAAAAAAAPPVADAAEHAAAAAAAAEAAAAEAASPVAAAFEAFTSSSSSSSSSSSAAAASAAAAAAGEGVFIRYVAEIAPGSSAKYEIKTSEPWNPIEQDRNADGEVMAVRDSREGL